MTKAERAAVLRIMDVIKDVIRQTDIVISEHSHTRGKEAEREKSVAHIRDRLKYDCSCFTVACYLVPKNLEGLEEVKKLLFPGEGLPRLGVETNFTQTVFERRRREFLLKKRKK